MKRNINCPCGKVFSAEYDSEIDLDKNAGVIDKILSGMFMSFDCPVCGKKHKPEYSVVVAWPSRNVRFEVLPELDRGDFYRSGKDAAGAETIIGYPELSDRVAVLRENLEPAVIEALKYYMLIKAEENYPDRDITAWYHANDSENIEFHLHGIREGEVAVMKIPLNIYNKTLDDYKKHPKKDIFASLRVRSYLSVQNLLGHGVIR